MSSDAISIPWYQQRAKAALLRRHKSLPEDSILPEEVPHGTLDVLDIPRSCGLLSKWELEVTERYDATELIRRLADQEFTAFALLNAFRKRASIAQQLTNCLTELLPEAVERARRADIYIRRTGKTWGPLHGLPVSVKEHIVVANHRTNAGFVAWVDYITPNQANLVSRLEALGAIIFARTNQSQSIMHLETSNNIYGMTTHPKNRLLTPGGSSGGEAALMMLCGSPLGFGSDIGGCIRVPASYCGLWGFKPSSGRYSRYGVIVPLAGCDSIKASLGPFTRSLRDIDLVQRTYHLTKPWIEDPSVLPYPVSVGNAAPLGRPLRVGVMKHDGVFTPLPPVQLVLEDVIERLDACPLIEWRLFAPLEHDRAWEIISANYFEEAGAKIARICEDGGEEVLPLTDWIMHECADNELAVASTPQGRKAARDRFRARYSRHWNAAGVDVVIAPVTPSVALTPDTSVYWAYSAVWNLLDYPALAIPASQLLGGYSMDLDRISYKPKTKEEVFISCEYDAKVAQAMPVGLQVVAKRYMDSECLAAAQMIERALRKVD